MDEPEIIYCQHVDENGWPERLFIPIGDRKVVGICMACHDRLNGIILTGIIEKAISHGILSHAAGVDMTQSISHLVRREMTAILREST